ncbi:TetR/AcrR family transcriptional regulator [Nocardia sp. NPDC051463]|uniref:TetR/AcrR family transcriptional regulator n=1 Tax=Nocardia sp. NPDC051463 TaxID=3154845 RepID=UPI003449847A
MRVLFLRNGTERCPRPPGRSPREPTTTTCRTPSACPGPRVHQRGPEASLNDIARRAGVGPGDLYRHFPSRQALQAAVLRARIDTRCEYAEDLSSSEPTSALTNWLCALLTHARTDHGLGGAVLAGPVELDFDCRQVIHQAGAVLLTKAQEAGGIRTDVTIDDVIQLIAGIALAARHSADPGQPDRLLRLVLDALRQSSE